MSIIEKAAGKLGSESKASHSVSIIEKAVEKIESDEVISAHHSTEMVSNDSLHATEMVSNDSLHETPGPAVETDTHQQVHKHAVTPESVSKQVTINLNKLRQQGIITPDTEKTQTAEEFRLIKRPLIRNAFQQGAGAIKNGNLIMITSALAGEGKSFCSINLAISIAMEMDHTVLLVDADVARPSLPKYLGINSEKGLLDVLLDEKLELADVMLKTNVEKLSILTAGKKNRHATELLASQSMSDLLQEIAHRYSDRIVIFDSPPLLLTSESHVLATQMGQIVMVVAAEKTPQQAVKEALRQIESCDVVNLIYNKASSFASGEYYGYNYN